MSKVDPKEAPKGYKAVSARDRGCEGCAFHSEAGGCFHPRADPSCTAEARADGFSVVFKKTNAHKALNKKTAWKDDHIQFARLLGEMNACDCEPRGRHMDALCASMDLTTADIYELFDRAQKAWDRIKAGIS